MEISEQLASLWGVRRSIGELSDEESLCIQRHAVEDVDKCVKWSEGEDECCQLDACTTGILDAWPAVQVEDWLTVDASKLGDFPAKYTVPNVRKNEFLAVGIYVDPRIVPGFKYRAKPINPTANGTNKAKWLWKGEALTLLSVGRGYSRRLTFAPGNGELNENPHYFWPDSAQHGFALEQELVSVGDKFTVLDASHLPVATLEVVQNQEAQEEVGMRVLSDGQIEKTARVKCLAKVEWYNSDRTEPTNTVPMRGVAVSLKSRDGKVTTKVTGATVGSHPRRGFTLTPGVDSRLRSIVIKGANIADVPTTYTVFGLESHELPVIGTYVDPRIIPGFHYRVRTAGSNRKPLFKSETEPRGQALKLLSIGMGYGKRLVFASESLNNPQHYLWSDSHLDGLGFEPSAVRAGMMFEVFAGELRLGSAVVFRADVPQIEKEQITTEEGVTKEIHVEITCTVVLDRLQDDSHTMRVSGTAVLFKPWSKLEAKLLRIDDIGLESQLNVLFTQADELVFFPL